MIQESRSRYLAMNASRSNKREMNGRLMQMRAQITSGKGIAPLIGTLCLAFICQLPCGAEINAKLIDPYLERNFHWAMFIEMHDLKSYLNYPGSKLNPVTQLRV